MRLTKLYEMNSSTLYEQFKQCIHREGGPVEDIWQDSALFKLLL